MEMNIILAGVGGQGIVAISLVIDMTAVSNKLHFKQAEVHGMSQRGGAVSSHLRVSDAPIHSDLIPRGKATVVLAVEPLESLRYIDFLSPHGAVVTSTNPFVNINHYGDIDQILQAIEKIPNHIMIPSERLARQAGAAKAQNMVMLGAATAYLQLSETSLEESIKKAFERKGERIQQANVMAFRIGKAAGQTYRKLLHAHVQPAIARGVVGRLTNATIAPDAFDAWKSVLNAPIAKRISDICNSNELGTIAATAELASSLQAFDLHQNDLSQDNKALAKVLFGQP